MQKKLFLLDAMALIYRSFYALNKNPRLNSKGLNTSATLGFVNTVYDLLKSQKPTHIGVAFDTQAPTFRHEKFESYKANRDAMPEDIASAIPYIRRFLESMNIPILICNGFEADDIIGTLAQKAEKEDFETYMVTPDKDFGQLITEKTFMYRLGRMGNKDEVWKIPQILERFEIERPEQVQDILGLWGDSSDNIPGIPGIGEKKAKMLIRQFGTIENMIDHVDQIENEKLRNLVKEHAKQALFSKELATIHVDVPIPFEEKMLERKAPNAQELKLLFDELEFRTFAKRFFTDLSLSGDYSTSSSSAQTSLFSTSAEPDLFSSSSHKSIKDLTVDYKNVESEDELKKLVNEISQEKQIAFACVTDESTKSIVGLAFSNQTGKAYFIPNFENTSNAFEVFKPVFENPDIAKIGYDFKLLKEYLQSYNIVLKGTQFDVLIAHYLLESESRHNLDLLAESYLNYMPIMPEDFMPKAAKGQKTVWTLLDADMIKNYCAEKADICLQLYNIFDKKLNEESLSYLFAKIEMPLVDVLLSMQQEGVRIDTQYLKEYSKQLQAERTKVEKEIYQYADVEFNIGSPKQLGDVLFAKMKIMENPKQTATKQFSTGEEILVKLQDKHPIIEKILEYRTISKLINTYLEAFPQLISPQTGRIHTSFNQTVTATGRLSSTNPNLQNIPIRTERGREIRKAFIPRNEEYTILSADYSQIELRIIAELSHDKHMLDAFSNNIDIHTVTASKIYKVPIEKVTPSMRRNSKSVNFGIIYGISAFGLSEQLSIPRKEASELIDGYFAQYPDIKKYIEDNIAFARESGYAQTLLGRRRKLNDINSRNNNLRSFAERNAVNMPIQGTAADMIKVAMVHIFAELNKLGLQSKMILQVHDELVFDVYKPELETVKKIVLEKMINALPMQVPIVVEINNGKNWLEAH